MLWPLNCYPLSTLKWRFLLQEVYSDLLQGVQACFDKYIRQTALRRQLQAGNGKFHPTLLRKSSLKITVAALDEQPKLKTCFFFPINLSIQANSVSMPSPSTPAVTI